MKALRYLTAPNHPQSDHTDKRPAIENGGDDASHESARPSLLPAQRRSRVAVFHRTPLVCRARKWPRCLHYAPCQVTAKVADGTEVAHHRTNALSIRRTKSNSASHFRNAPHFPLYLRIPEWCDDASISLAGQKSERKSAGQNGENRSQLEKRRQNHVEFADESCGARMDATITERIPSNAVR